MLDNLLHEGPVAKVRLKKHPGIIDLFLPSQVNNLTQLNKYETDRKDCLLVAWIGNR